MSDWPIVSTTLTVSNAHGEADWLLEEAGRRGLWTGAIVEELVREKMFGHPDLRLPDNHYPGMDDS